MRIHELIEKTEQKKSEKITRDAFLYLPPKTPKNQFAQCGTCGLFLPGKKRCRILGPKVEVTAEKSCGFYLHGTPSDQQKCEAIVTAEEAGLVDRQVRCENCTFGNNGKCDLYAMLNKAKPNVFDLDETIESEACCNAQTPRG